jgi:hypothetical protein
MPEPISPVSLGVQDPAGSGSDAELQSKDYYLSF